MIEDALDPDLTKRGLEATLETFKDRTGNNPDVATGEGFDGFSVSRYMLFRDPAFEGILMAEKVLALVDYLIGDDCILSTLTGHRVKVEAKHYQRVTCLCTGTMVPHSPKPEFITSPQ